MADELVQSAPTQGTSRPGADEQDGPGSPDRDQEAAAIAPNEVQRLEVLSTAAPGIALEFGNVMTIVLGSLEQLHRQPLNAAGREQLQRAASGTRQVTRLIRQALTLARRASGREQLVELNEVVRGIDKMLTHTAGETVELTFELGRGPLLVRLETACLELALLRIVRHVREAMGSADRIVIRTSGYRAEGLGGQATIELVTICRCDSSLGAAPCYPKLIPPLLEDLVASCNGTMTVETAVAGGTTVRLAFPRASEGR